MESRRPHARPRKVVEGRKVCEFCELEYDQHHGEHPARHCCYSYACELARERRDLARRAERRCTPRPEVTAAPPRPLLKGNT